MEWSFEFHSTWILLDFSCEITYKSALSRRSVVGIGGGAGCCMGLGCIGCEETELLTLLIIYLIAF